MSKRSRCQSALFIGTGDADDDDAVVVVGGGDSGKWGGAALLTNHPRESKATEVASGGGSSCLLCKRIDPVVSGLITLRRGRVLVFGGDWS